MDSIKFHNIIKGNSAFPNNRSRLLLATLTMVWVEVLSDGTCLESQVICTVAPKSFIHVLFRTGVEILSALPS